VLRVEQRPDPTPGPGQVRIAVEAAGLTFSDILARTGLYPDAPKPPCVLGYEVAGTVESLGSGIEGLHAGDRVMAATRFGGQAELAVAQATDTLPLPDSFTMAEGAAIPVNYGTAYAALVLMAGVRPGERVLIHSSAGGVGTAATQIAHRLGGFVIGTASAHKHERCRAEGADEVVDHRTANVPEAVRRLTGGEGVDVILDALGPRTLRQDWRLLRPGGRVVAYGASQVQTGDRRSLRSGLAAVAAFPFATVPWWKGPAVINENKGFFGLNLLHWWDAEGSLERLMTPLRALLADGVIRPVVDSTFPFERAADAHRRVMDGANTGKVVLTA
jgi:NADPH:quinone reductase-like Zn-dependent oxidoreductase